MSRSYAKVAASRPGSPARPAHPEKATKFIYAEHLPTTTIITKKIVKKTLFLKDDFEMVESAQKNFNLGDQGPLESLDISGEITDYVINLVDGATVDISMRSDLCWKVFGSFYHVKQYLIQRIDDITPLSKQVWTGSIQLTVS